jgi:branched-chain amino acid transport system substrate-binding protein
VRQEIRDMYKKAGKEPPKAMADTVMYNRGILWAALHTEATRNAIEANGGKKPTGEEVKKGFESIKDFSLGGLVPPLQVTAADHQGGGWVQIFQVKDGRFVKETDWFRAYPEVVAEAVQKAE